jgi:copper chaperone NosL
MSPIRSVAIVAFALLTAACSAKAAGPPEIVVDRTVCSHCGMLVSEPIYAAAYQAFEQPPRVFDDIGCMLEALKKEAASPVHAWFQDANGDGWLDANTAITVASKRVSTPMNGGLLAFADTAAAAKAAAAHHGDVVGSLPQLVVWKGGPR